MAVDGKWTITINSPMGAQQADLEFKTEGGKLTGKQSSKMMGSADIVGTVDGDKVAWPIKMTAPMPMNLEFSGTIAGDAISGNVKAGSFGSFPFSGKRA